jgi:NAD(P)-dependent dehydrogenase (short-subunit alcohol dehydrogenase family)
LDRNRFEGRVVIVTGAASGIGRAIISAFVREGAKGVIADVDREWADRVADGLRAEGGEVLVHTVDIARADQVDALMDAVIGKYGGLDILVNNAGVGVHKEVVELTEEDWDYQVDVQLKGAFLCSRAAARHMIRQGRGGRIVNIGSGAATNARVQAGPHCASKAGVVMLTKVMAQELGKHQITVNCVSPGLTDISTISRHGGATPEYVANHLTMIPLGRLARPEEIAHAVLFMASDQAAFITGQHLAVDGGYGAGKLNIQGPHASSR